MFSIYCIFCVTTALIANYRVFTNVLALLPPDDVLNTSKVMSRITFFVLSLITAPVLFLVVVVPSLEARFTIAMAESIEEKT